MVFLRIGIVCLPANALVRAKQSVGTDPSRLYYTARSPVVAVAGDEYVIGVPGGEGGGYVVFNSRFGTPKEVYPIHREDGDGFGSSVAFDGVRILVGATGEDSAAYGIRGGLQDNSAADSGAAYAYNVLESNIPFPEINILGNGISIADDDDSPEPANLTHFGSAVGQTG